MPDSIIVPTLDPQYDLTFLSPLQQWLLPFEIWWELFLWIVFAVILVWQGYRYVIKPNFL